MLVAGALLAVPAFGQAIAPVERNMPPAVMGQGRLMIGPQETAARRPAI